MMTGVVKRKNGFFLALLLVCEMIFLAACGGSGGDSVPKAASGAGSDKGTLAVSLTDASGCEFDGVFVTVQKVRVHENPSASDNDSGWIEIPLPNGPQLINLLTLQNGLTEELGVAELPAGKYTQVRLVLVPNNGDTPPFKDYITLGGVTSPLSIPAGFQNGIKLSHEFEIKTGEQEELILDFDACRSVVKAKDGTYFLRPNVLIVKKTAAGRIIGAVDAASSGAIVKAEVNGFVYKQTRIKADGTFVLYPLPSSDMVKTLFPQDTEGTYDVVIVSDATATVLTTGVPVTAQKETLLSTTTHPIHLSISSIGVLDGQIKPTSADARIRQTINGKTYQVDRHHVDLIDGSFLFELAIESPWFGAYSTTLPITFQKDPSNVEHTLDTPNDDGLYKVSSQSIAMSSKKSIPVITLEPTVGTAGMVNGTLALGALPAHFSSGIVLVSATRDHENVNSKGVPINQSGAFPFILDDLAPGTYTITILSAKGFPHITPAGVEIVIPETGGTFTGADFSLSNH
jgi:hypothetical protein